MSDSRPERPTESTGSRRRHAPAGRQASGASQRFWAMIFFTLVRAGLFFDRPNSPRLNIAGRLSGRASQPALQPVALKSRRRYCWFLLLREMLEASPSFAEPALAFGACATRLR